MPVLSWIILSPDEVCLGHALCCTPTGLWAGGARPTGKRCDIGLPSIMLDRITCIFENQLLAVPAGSFYKMARFPAKVDANQSLKKNDTRSARTCRSDDRFECSEMRFECSNKCL